MGPNGGQEEVRNDYLLVESPVWFWPEVSTVNNGPGHFFPLWAGPNFTLLYQGGFVSNSR